MENHFHTNVTRNQFVQTQHFSSECSRLLRRFTRLESTKGLLQKAREVALHCLTTLGVGMLFLGGAYFFLIQLANYGW